MSNKTDEYTIDKFVQKQEGTSILDLMLQSIDTNNFKQSSTENLQNTFQKMFRTIPQSNVKYEIKKNWFGKDVVKKSYTTGTMDSYDFGNNSNAGFPILPYFYTGGSLYNITFLNLITTASFYSAYAQVVPVADAIDMITQACINIPINLYKKEITTDHNGEIVMQEIEYNPFLEKRKKKNKKSIEGEYFGNDNKKDDYITNICNLLSNPNPILQRTTFEWKNSTCYELGTTGNAFWIKEYDKSVTKKQLVNCEDVIITNWRVGKTFEFTQDTYVTVDFYTVPTWRETRYGYMSGYIIRYNDVFLDIYGNLRMLGTYKDTAGNDRICEVYLVSTGIGNTYVGQSKLLRCYPFAQIHYLGALWTKAFFQNAGAPCGIVQIKPHNKEDNTIQSQEQLNAIASLIRDQLKGASNAGKHLMWTNPSYELTYTPISSTIKDADVSEQMKYATEMIYQSYGISSTLKNRSGDRYNILQEEVRFYKEAVFPMADLLVSNLNKFFISCNKTMREKFCFKYDESSIPEFNAMTVENLLKAKDYFKINEGRKILGLPDGGPECDFIPIQRNVGAVESGIAFEDDRENNI